MSKWRPNVLPFPGPDSKTLDDEKYPFRRARCYPQAARPHFGSGEWEAARHVPTARCDRNKFPGQGSDAWEALDLIPHGALQGAVREVFFYWQTASSESRGGKLPFFKKKPWQAHRLPWEEQHNEKWPRGHLFCENLLLYLTNSHSSQLSSVEVWIPESGGRHAPSFSCIKILVCLHCTRLDREAYHSPHTVTLNRETSELFISEPVNMSSSLLERLQSGLNNKWLPSAFLIEMRININAIICWWIQHSAEMDQHLNSII